MYSSRMIVEGNDSSTPQALVFGATGLIGKALLPLLCDAWGPERVHSIQRRATSGGTPQTQESQPAAETAGPRQHVVPLENLDSLTLSEPFTDAYCCLGTTRRAAGSTEAFRHVDYDLVLLAARFALRHGVQHFLLVSSIGADASSSALYLKTKGQVEDAVAKLGFPRLSILRPSLLLGDRQESRPGEKWAQVLTPVLSPLLVGKLARYRPIPAASVARALRKIAAGAGSGTRIYESTELSQLAAP